MRGQPFGRRSTTRFALPTERSMPPQSITRTSALTPMRLLDVPLQRSPRGIPLATAGVRGALDEHRELVKIGRPRNLELIVRPERGLPRG